MTKLPGVAGEIQGDPVNVYTGEDTYEGRAVNLDYNLEGITVETDEGLEWVEEFEAIDHRDSVLYLEKTDLSRITPNRFSTREYSTGYVSETAAEIRRSEGQEFIPTVQKMPEGHYEVVDGHKTLHALHEAGHTGETWVRIHSQEETGLETFTEDHYPQRPGQNGGRTYSDDELHESLSKMNSVYPENFIRDTLTEGEDKGT